MPKAIPRPSILDDLVRVPRKGETRWRSLAGDRLYTWDSMHGEVEVFNGRGEHLGAVDPLKGVLVKRAVKGRHIDV